MVVNQKLLNSKLMKYNIGANVFNKLTGQQAQTPAQQPTNTPITQTRGTQGLQQQPETYKVITNKFPTYDIKDIMGFGPQAVKNQLGFANSMSQYNRLQAQADTNTDPNVRYNLTKPELTNKQTLQIQQATPETNEQGLKINKTNSFKDLVIDLQNVANQGRNLEFVKFRDLYPEYVENWDEVLDLYESIKANPSYTTEQITQNAQKKYPELFGIKDNLSDKDKTTALKKLYDEMVSNKQNGIQLTQQDIIDRYPEYANTEDINTVMEVQNLMNRDRKNTPTFNDIYENFESLTKGDVAIGNAEKKTMKNDISKIENMSQSTYEHLSDEGKKYVEYLSTAEAVKQALGEQYYVGDKSGVEIAESLKNSDPELYKEIFGDVNVSNLSEEDRKLLDEGYTIGAMNSMWQQIKHSATEGLAGLGRKLQQRAGTEWKGEWNPQPVRGQREDGTYEFNPLLKEDGTYETNPIKIREIKMAGNNYQQRVRTQEYRGKNPGLDKLDFKLGELLFGLGEEMQRAGEKGMEKIESSQAWKDVAELNKTSFWDALKKGDVKTMLSKSTAAIGQSAIPLVVGYATGNPVATFGAMYPGSYERAMQDIEADESLKDMTQEEKERAARLMATTESAIEEISLSMVAPKMFGDKSILDAIGGESFKKLMNNAIIKGITQTELGAASEGGEEVLQELFNNLITQSYGSDRELGDLQDYRNIFTETFLSSQLLSAFGGTMEGIDQAKQNQIENQIQKQGELRNTVLEGQALISEDFNDFAQRVEEVPGTTTEELQQVWNNAQQKKQDLENKANGITSNSYNNVNVPTYERTTVKENEQPKLSAKDSQEYTDLLDEMEKNGEITKEDRKKVEMSLGVFTRNTEKTETQQTEGLAEVAETPKTEKRTGWWTRKMSGLDNETITRIENNPYISSYWNNAVNMVEKEGLSMDNGKIIEQPMQELGEELLKRIEKAEKDLGEDGRMYRLIKNIQQTYDLSDSRKGIEGVLKNYDITTNEDGKLDFSNSQFIKAEDTNAISRAVELLNNTDLTNITPKQYWNLRKKLSSLSGFDKGTSKDGEAVVRQLRHLVDQLAKDNIPGLKKVDEIFSKELKYLEEIKQGLVYQQGERKGQIKDNFYSILKTINNQNRQQMNQRLEKIMPDLSDKVEAINMLPKLLKAYAVKSRLIEVGARNIGKVGGAVTGGIPGLVVGYVFDEITGKVSKNLRKNAINKIVNSMSDTAKQRLEDIAAKQEEKETLTQEERETLNQVKAEIEKIIEQENNEQKPQTPSETEKKSKPKNVKAEQTTVNEKISENKIVDKNGKPKNVYHYTNTEFDKFDPSKMKNKLGVYFSPSSKPHSKYYKYKITATIDMKNPLTISPTNKSSMIYPELKELMERPEESKNRNYEQRSEYLAKQEDQFDVKFRELLQKDGYDGVIMLDDKGNVSQYVVLDPDQIHIKNRKPVNEDVQKENNGLAKINETKEETKTEGLSEMKRLGNESDYTQDNILREGDGEVQGEIKKGDKSIIYNISDDGDVYIDGYSLKPYIKNQDGLLGLVAKLENSMEERGLNNLYIEMNIEDEVDNYKPESDETYTNSDEWQTFLNELEELGFNVQYDAIDFIRFYKDTAGSFLILDEHAGEQPLFSQKKLEQDRQRYEIDKYYQKGLASLSYDQRKEMATKDAEVESARGVEEGQRAMLSEQEKAQQYFDSQEGLAKVSEKRDDIKVDINSIKNISDLRDYLDSKTVGEHRVNYGYINGKYYEIAELIGEYHIVRGNNPSDIRHADNGVAIGGQHVNTINGLKAFIEGKNNIEVIRSDRLAEEENTEKPITNNSSVTIEPQETAEGEFETLPADVSVYDESKTTGPKRISPDRGGWWQQLTPKEAIDKKIEQITKDRQRRTEQYDKKLNILNGYIEKFGDSISQNDRSKEATEARKIIRNEIINPYRLGNFFTAGALGQIKEVFERWKSQQNAEITDKNREDINRDYIQHVKEDISHGYRYPEAVLSYNPEFRKAVDNRARYEKGLYTSFSTDDTRIVDYKKDQIGAGMKRQDGKELTQEQKDEIANGVINYQETMGIDIKRLAENNNWVYVHLNGKNPFLMGSQGGIAGLYRGSVDEKGRSTASISVGGTESYQIREDGKIVTKKKKTTMAHELTHALDALSSRKLLSESAYNDLRLKFNDYDSRGLHRSSYWTSKSEITARMVEEYVAVQNGDTEIFNEKGYWDQETYNSVIEPEINKIKNNFFQEYKEGIGGDSIEQIKADAIIRGLAEISNQ